MHEEPHKWAGKTVRLKADVNVGPITVGPTVLPAGSLYHVEDWQDRVFGFPWHQGSGNPACMQFGFRCGAEGVIPTDANLYGKVEHLGYILREDEVEEIPEGEE